MNKIKELSTRDRRRIRTRNLILHAAQELLEENGLENLTLTDIAQRAAYSKPAVYEYFDGIEHILSELSSSGFMQLGELAKKVNKDMPADKRLVAMGHNTLSFAADNTELYKLMFTRMVIAPEPAAVNALKSTTQTAYWMLVETIQEGIEQEIFRTRPGFDWKAMSYVTWTLIHGMASLKQTLMDELEYDVELYREQAFRFLIDSLRGEISS